MNRRGLTLAELMIGSLLVFAAASTMAMVLGSSARYLTLQRQRCQALQVAWQELHRCVLDDTWSQYIDPVGGVAGLGFTGSCDVTRYGDLDGPYAGSWELHRVDYTIRMPDGAALSLSTCKHFSALADVVCTSTGNVLFAGGGPGYLVNVWRGPGQLTSFPALPLVPQPTPPPYQPRANGILCGTNPNDLWVSDDNGWGLHHWQAGWPPYTQSDGIDGGGRPMGMAGNDAMTQAWVVDNANRCLRHWHLDTRTWDPAAAPPAPQPPLLMPVHVFWDQTGGTIYVTDQGNACLRNYDPVSNRWSDLIRPSGYLMGMPRGVTMDDKGNLYTADGENMYIERGNAWSQVPLPSKLQCNVRSLQYSRPRGLLYINVDASQLWDYNPANGQFSFVAQGT